MQRKIIITADGSPSIWVPDLNESYHSRFGAVQESMHVFIEAGLWSLPPVNGPVYILEIGFGTGLNAMLTAQEAEKLGLSVMYESLEPFPLQAAELDAFAISIDTQQQVLFKNLHSAAWQQVEGINNYFSLLKNHCGIAEYEPSRNFQLVYFDAFAPDVQPELWTDTIFSKLFNCMATGGILTTYCAKGGVRRTLESVGFKVEKLAGPPGKREMIRARKSS